MKLDLTKLVPVERPTGDADGRRLTFTPFTAITETAIEWMWSGYLAFGFITAIVAAQGSGKTLWTDYVSAVVSCGGQFPGQSQPVAAAPVLRCFCEDVAGSVVRPRLRVAGADMALVEVVAGADAVGNETEFQIPRDLDLLRAKIAAYPTQRGVLVVDPVSHYLGDRVDRWREDKVRAALIPLKRLAEDTGWVVIIVMHVNRRTTFDALDKAMGSSAFTGVTRLTLMITQHPDDVEKELGDRRRMLATVKNNLGRAARSLVFSIRGDGPQQLGPPRIIWEGETHYTVEDALRARQEGKAAKSQTAQCMDWLREFLAGGPRTVADIETHASGFSKDVLGDASRKLKLDKQLVAGDGKQWWEWALPPAATV